MIFLRLTSVTTKVCHEPRTRESVPEAGVREGWGMLNQKDGTTYAGQWVSGLPFRLSRNRRRSGPVRSQPTSAAGFFSRTASNRQAAWHWHADV